MTTISRTSLFHSCTAKRASFAKEVSQTSFSIFPSLIYTYFLFYLKTATIINSLPVLRKSSTFFFYPTKLFYSLIFLRIIVSTSTKRSLFTVTFFLQLSVKICQFTNLTATLFHRCTCSDRLSPRRASYKGIENYLLVEGSA